MDMTTLNMLLLVFLAGRLVVALNNYLYDMKEQ